MRFQLPKEKKLLVPLCIGAALLVFLLFRVDDWSRDFTTHEAFISEDAEDPTLRAARLPLTTPEAAEAVRRAAGRIRNWEYVGEAADDDALRVIFVRTSRIWRFKDDVVIRIASDGGTRVISGESRSRIGIGDLGRNPRTLRRFLAELRDVYEGSTRYRGTPESAGR
jgi:uncharacterized protein (DUF1499 family)